MIADQSPSVRTNRYATISILAAILTMLSFCMAVVPIPLTGFVCFPAAAALGAAAVVAGTSSLRQIRSSGEKGRHLALAGIGIGVLVGLGALCLMALGAALLARIMDFIRSLAPGVRV